MNDAVLSILQDALGTYTLSYDDNVMFHCPFCKHSKRKLSVKITSGVWRCWVCPNKGRNIFGLLKKINAPDALIRRLKPHYHESEHQSSRPIIKSAAVGDIKIPTEYIPLHNAPPSVYRDLCLRYLENRGITEYDIFRYKIGYAESGVYDRMVIIPDFNTTGALTYFTTRAFSSMVHVKMRNPKLPKSGVVGFENMINFELPVCLVEGAFDAITMRFNTVPKYGKFISQCLKERLLNVPELIFCPDGDAIKECLVDVKYFLNMGVPCKLVMLENGQDPNSVGHAKMWELVDKTGYVTNMDLLKIQLQ